MDLSKEDNEEALYLQHGVQSLVAMVTKYTEALPIYRIYPTPMYKKVKQSILTVRGVGRKYLERHRRGVEKRIREGGSTEGLSLLEQWMIQGHMSEEDCITGAVDVFIAGIDTVSTHVTQCKWNPIHYTKYICIHRLPTMLPSHYMKWQSILRFRRRCGSRWCLCWERKRTLILRAYRGCPI